MCSDLCGASYPIARRYPPASLLDGYRSLQRDARRYSMNLLTVERQLAKRDDCFQCPRHGLSRPAAGRAFGHPPLDNVRVVLRPSIYQGPREHLRLRTLQVHGDMRAPATA